MKVLNYTTSYFAAILLVIITVWAGIFYYAMLDEIYDSIDDGLDNQKGLILQKLAVDTSILQKSGFDEGDYSIIKSVAPQYKAEDRYIDTMMFMQNEQDFEPIRMLQTGFYSHGNYYQMQVITSMVEEDDLVKELLYALLWLYLGVITIILFLNNILLKRIWGPFYHLLKQLKNFRLEEPEIEVKSTNIDEFRLLNEAVQKMVKSNISSYISQKHFIENAAHELQTPLSISLNKLEALAETVQLTEKESELLVSVLNNLERLTRLNKSLLLLSKIENRQFLSEEQVQINALVRTSIADFADQLEYSEISVSLVEKNTVDVLMNRDLAVVMINNLIKNAIVHNYRGGNIQILIAERKLSITNTGKNEELNSGLMFTRFNKTRQSETSIGLGLAIVKAIAELFNFDISYTYNDEHIFSVIFGN